MNYEDLFIVYLVDLLFLSDLNLLIIYDLDFNHPSLSNGVIRFNLNRNNVIMETKEEIRYLNSLILCFIFYDNY